MIGERLPDGSLAYPRVCLIVPRRAGKTLLMLATALERGRLERRRRAFYAAHRRETAADMWREDWFPLLEDGPLARYVKLRRANGSEAISWRHSLSTLKLMPPDGAAMRSFRSDLAMVDEAREFTPAQGEAVESGVFPTQATGTGGQTWIVSNAGGPHSTWLAAWRARGQVAADEQRRTGLAFFEWSAPDDSDPNDPAVLDAAHPGLGHHVRRDALLADLEVMSVEAWSTEYLGIWGGTLTDSALVDAWHRCADDQAAIDPAHGVTIAVETSVERDRSVIALAGWADDRTPVVEVVEDQAHGPWLAPRVIELADRWGALSITWDRSGPANANAVDWARAVGAQVPLDTPTLAAACGAWVDATHARGYLHRPDERLDAAVTAVRWRKAGGSRVIDRLDPTALPALAIAQALRAAHTHRTPSIH